MASGFGTLPAMVNRSRVLEIIVVLGFCLFLFAYGLGSFGLTGADEPRYAQIAREMLARHDWVTPVLYGKVWLEKPILYYWLAMASYKIFGVSDWAARVPSAVFATLMVMGVYLFSLRMRRGMQLDAALMTASCALVLGMARGASTDMPLAASFAVGMLCWYVWYESGRRRFLLAFHFLIALGMLAKGPVAPFLAAAHHRWLLPVGARTSPNRQDVVDSRSAVVSRGGAAVVRRGTTSQPAISAGLHP